MKPIPPKVRVEMIQREIHGLDIELSNIYVQHAAMLKHIEELVELRVSLVRQIEQTSQ